MREIIFDTETTGLNAGDDRIIEIGAVELENRFPTGRTYHVYINPEGKQVHPDAQAVHGISNADLEDKPVFRQVLDDWMAFSDGAKLVAHNASFDVGFFNAEYKRLGLEVIDPERVIDTLALARRKHPMGPNSLDALCRRYGIDNSHRQLHGALLDSELLAEVYIELIGGKQAALGLADPRQSTAARSDVQEFNAGVPSVKPRPQPLPSRLSDAERAAHAAMVEKLGDEAIWKKRTA